MLEKSTIASNRLAIDKCNLYQGGYRECVPARYLEDNKAWIYTNWSKRIWQQFGTKPPCRNTFYNYVNKFNVFKSPHRLTDLCEYCEKLKELKVSLPRSLRQLGYDQENMDVINLTQANNFLKAKEVNINQ